MLSIISIEHTTKTSNYIHTYMYSKKLYTDIIIKKTFKIDINQLCSIKQPYISPKSGWYQQSYTTFHNFLFEHSSQNKHTNKEIPSGNCSPDGVQHLSTEIGRTNIVLPLVLVSCRKAWDIMFCMYASISQKFQSYFLNVTLCIKTKWVHPWEIGKVIVVDQVDCTCIWSHNTHISINLSIDDTELIANWKENILVLL